MGWWESDTYQTYIRIPHLGVLIAGEDYLSRDFCLQLHAQQSYRKRQKRGVPFCTTGSKDGGYRRGDIGSDSDNLKPFYYRFANFYYVSYDYLFHNVLEERIISDTMGEIADTTFVCF